MKRHRRKKNFNKMLKDFLKESSEKQKNIKGQNSRQLKTKNIKKENKK